MYTEVIVFMLRSIYTFQNKSFLLIFSWMNEPPYHATPWLQSDYIKFSLLKVEKANFLHCCALLGFLNLKLYSTIRNIINIYQFKITG